MDYSQVRWEQKCALVKRTGKPLISYGQAGWWDVLAEVDMRADGRKMPGLYLCHDRQQAFDKAKAIHDAS